MEDRESSGLDPPQSGSSRSRRPDMTTDTAKDVNVFGHYTQQVLWLPFFTELPKNQISTSLSTHLLLPVRTPVGSPPGGLISELRRCSGSRRPVSLISASPSASSSSSPSSPSATYFSRLQNCKHLLGSEIFPPLSLNLFSGDPSSSLAWHQLRKFSFLSRRRGLKQINQGCTKCAQFCISPASSSLAV